MIDGVENERWLAGVENGRWIEHLVKHTGHVLPLKLPLLQKTGEFFGIAYLDVHCSL